MKSSFISRRDFLKLLPLSLYSLLPATLWNQQFVSGFSPPLFPIGPENSDVLSEAQKQALFASSLHFLAPDEESANQVALEIDFIEGLNEHSSTMCGPLSISILRRANLLGSWVEPRDFWLLNPLEDLLTASNVFPKHRYDWFHFQEPLLHFDFSSFPLLAGDLLYLHASGFDTYEHILVVNRIDSFGRAFTVSNFFNVAGTVIEERLLYDPRNKSAGQFQRWADRSLRNTSGNTGGFGFRIWRVKDGGTLDFSSDPASVSLRNSLDHLFLSGIGTWFAEIRELGGSSIYQFNPYEAFHPASTIKVPIAMAFMHWLERQQEADPENFLAEKGTAGRTYQQLLRAMLVESEEEATQQLIDFLDEHWIIDLWKSWGFSQSRLSPRRSSATELLNIFEELLLGELLSKFSREYLLELLATHTPSDETRIGLIKDLLPAGSQIFNKRGSLVEAPRVLADSGILSMPNSSGSGMRKFLYTFHGLGKDGASYESLESMLDEAIKFFGEFLTSA